VPGIIDTRFLDVDFQVLAPTLGRQTGCPDESKFAGPVRPFSASGLKIIPESDWKTLSARDDELGGSAAERNVLWVHDQNGDPSCVSNAWLAAMENCMVRQFGRQRAVQMSAMSLYNRVGSPRSGSNVTTNLRELETKGALPLDTPENRTRFKHVMRHNGYGRCPDGWEETGKQFRVLASEWFEVDGIDEFVSALFAGWPVVYARNGHCIMAVRWVWNGSIWALKYLNSWGSWGGAGGEFGKGFGFDSASLAKKASWGYALRQIVMPDYALGV